MFKRILSTLIISSFLINNAYALNLSRVKTWTTEVLTHTDLNAEFDNILNHAIANADVSATAAIVGSKLDLSVPGIIGATTPANGSFTTLVAATSLNPDAADGASIGTSSLEWSDIYLADSAVIYFGLDQDEKLTHNPDIGLILGGTSPQFTIGDAGAEDAQINFDGNAQDYHIGLDDTDDDFKIGLGTVLGTTSHIVIDEAGRVTKPLQPMFLITSAGNQSNIAVGSDVTVVFDTEVFDIGGNFASNTFTAPVTGKYLLETVLRTNEIDSAGVYYLRIITSNRTYVFFFDATKFSGDLGNHSLSLNVIADMDVNDTAYVTLQQASGTQQTDIVSAAPPDTHFSGILLM